MVALPAMLATIIAGPVAGEVFKWLDESGKVHYGDRAPAREVDSQELDVGESPAVSADQRRRAETQRRLLEAFEAERAERVQAEARAVAAEDKRRQRCEQVRRELAAVERANVIYSRGEDGERVYMSDSEREKAVAAARAWMKKSCR